MSESPHLMFPSHSAPCSKKKSSDVHEDFTTYFTEDQIIKNLCKIRIKQANKKQRNHLIEKLVKTTKKTNTQNLEEIYSYFPKRRSWVRLNQKEREQCKDNQEVLFKSLLKTIENYKRKYDDTENIPIWLSNLNTFIRKIHSDILHGKCLRIDAPEIHPEVKDKKPDSSSKKITCRPIAIYSLKDRLIIGQTAKYLTYILDDYFLECSHAFRSSKKRQRNHHTAIEEILNYKKKYNEKDLWVTECDIKKFFDSINHRALKHVFLNFAQKIDKDSKCIDERAVDIFFSYLGSYSFCDAVFPLNQDIDYFNSKNIPLGTFGWIKDELSNIYSDLDKYKIGVPQGGAISCLIANIYLHYADTRVLHKKDSDLLYLRYCDDMVIIHPNKIKCKNALRRYKNALNKINLVPHEEENINFYNKIFWNEKIKSKAPYLWGKNSKGGIPWLSFVGYQIGVNGQVRIRKKTQIKELKKQREKCKSLFRQIKRNKNIRKSYEEINESLHSQLISMSVGRIKIYKIKDMNQNICWTNGFKKLTDHKDIIKQMKELDRNRNKQLNKIMLKLSRHLDKESIKVIKPKVLLNKREKNILFRRYYGAPFSYYNYLKNINSEYTGISKNYEKKIS